MSDSVRPHRQQLTRLPRPWDSPGKNTGVGCHFRAAAVGLAGAGVAAGLAACKPQESAPPPKAADTKASETNTAAAPAASGMRYDVPPGQLDDYYIFSSGGHSGEVRVYGLPSGRTIKRIPVFNVDPMVGWGITNESKKILGTKPDGTLRFMTGDTHHVHGSYTDGTYNGKYLWVNDKRSEEHTS